MLVHSSLPPTPPVAATAPLPPNPLSGLSRGTPIAITDVQFRKDFPAAVRIPIDLDLADNEHRRGIGIHSSEETSTIEIAQSLARVSHDLVFRLRDDLRHGAQTQKIVTVNS